MSLSRLAGAVARPALLAVPLLAILGWTRPAAAQTCDPNKALRAHPSHTRDSGSHLALACTECHAPLCSATGGATVSFGELARSKGAVPVFDPATKTCSGVYCHGSRLVVPNSAPESWTYVDVSVPKPRPQECSMCHGYPPPPPHMVVGQDTCHGCHPAVVLADGSVDVAGGKHIDGLVEASGGACGSCHALPPPTGAHAAHFGLPSSETSVGYADVQVLQDRYPGATPTTAPAAYAFGCALCHTVDGTRHNDGTVDMILVEPAAPAGSLKARNAATAAYDGTARTCSGVYCHSTGQAAPTFKTTPGWFSGQAIGCAGCHDNPPAYPSDGAGTSTANSHLQLADDGYEFGHFLGMPGPFHTSQHGGSVWGSSQDASPITCQACHYDTTDPANAGPSGFYYLDTTGNYALPGGDPWRISSGWQAQQQCGYCHKAGGAATGTGRVLPLRHVNGTRDVVFDPRDALPAFAWLPQPPNLPTRPTWMTGASNSLPWPSSVTRNGTTVSFGLGGVGYDPATKTCSGVACHMADANPVWGRPYQYYTNQSATCYRCHPM